MAAGGDLCALHVRVAIDASIYVCNKNDASAENWYISYNQYESDICSVIKFFVMRVLYKK